eukprot:3460865-Rhodomonas_salina.2
MPGSRVSTRVSQVPSRWHRYHWFQPESRLHGTGSWQNQVPVPWIQVRERTVDPSHINIGKLSPSRHGQAVSTFRGWYMYPESLVCDAAKTDVVTAGWHSDASTNSRNSSPTWRRLQARLRRHGDSDTVLLVRQKIPRTPQPQ